MLDLFVELLLYLRELLRLERVEVYYGKIISARRKGFQSMGTHMFLWAPTWWAVRGLVMVWDRLRVDSGVVEGWRGTRFWWGCGRADE